MSEKSICIMLVDDNPDDNFFHERAIKENNPADIVITKYMAMDALEYLKIEKEGSPYPDLIFLDINMPSMNGWEFLEQYDCLDKKLQSRAIIIMLTTSENPDDLLKAQGWACVSDYRSKPLTVEIMKEIVGKYFGRPP